ncbi:MAG: LysR substrate-binding domain-containing protein [Gammaproteobacteria bacterium]|nr:LysR substrate-binding domain-containing protein [Gammaproteobacteria bacterium]
MPKLPPLECLRYFESAARHESFVRAGRELGVTPAAVAYRIKVLEEHLGRTLFERHRRSVSLNSRGKACLGDVQRVLSEIGEIAEIYGSDRSRRRLSIAAAESIADRWLMPRLSGFRALEPDVAIEIETDLIATNPDSPDVDLWITYAGEPGGPPAPQAQHEILFEETLFPFCSPGLIEARSRPARASDLRDWPFLYHLGRPTDWLNWFAAHETTAPNLAHGSGFRLSGMLVKAAVEGMGVAVGPASSVDRELQQGSLVELFDRDTGPRTSCSLVSTVWARSRPEVRAFREWILRETAPQRLATGVDGP